MVEITNFLKNLLAVIIKIIAAAAIVGASSTSTPVKNRTFSLLWMYYILDRTNMQKLDND